MGYVSSTLAVGGLAFAHGHEKCAIIPTCSQSGERTSTREHPMTFFPDRNHTASVPQASSEVITRLLDDGSAALRFTTPELRAKWLAALPDGEADGYTIQAVIKSDEGDVFAQLDLDSHSQPTMQCYGEAAIIRDREQAAAWLALVASAHKEAAAARNTRSA